MLIIAGYARTGTSILFKCLEKSGFYGGSGDEINGHYYKTQHVDFGQFSHKIANYGAANRLYFPIRARMLPPSYISTMLNIGDRIQASNINLIKNPLGALSTQPWLDIVPAFREPRFIRIKRDPLETAKSCVRAWRTTIKVNLDSTVRDALEFYDLHNELWDLTCKDHPTVRMNYDEFFNNLPALKDRLSDFIGCEFDTSLIDVNKTYRMSKKIY
jgi:hypothetical protein